MVLYVHHSQGKLFKGLQLCRPCPQHAGSREPSYHKYQLNPQCFPLFVYFFPPVKLLSLSLCSSRWTALHASRRSKVIRRERIWIFAFLIPCLSAFLWKVYILAWLVDNDYMQTSLDMQITSGLTTNIYRKCTKWPVRFMN